jgi:hypothetical protein
LIQMCCMTNGSTHLSTWVTQETKQRFGALAQGLGLSESALLKRSVHLMLKSTNVSDALPTQPPKLPRDLRLYVRLRADDHGLLRERADGRGMAAATYASMVLRAHLRSVTPLPERELTELRRSVGALGVIGRNLNQIARVANQTGKLSGPSSADLRGLLRALEGLRDHVKALMLANTASWESGHAEANR